MQASSRYQRSQALVLSVYKALEKDLRVVLLHQHDGKRWLSARGARSSRRGVQAALQPGNHVEVLLYRSGEHDTLQQAEILHSPLTQVVTPQRLNVLHYLLWITQHWCEWNTAVPTLYELLRKGVETVCAIEDTRLSVVSRRFERALLVEEGLWPTDQNLTFGDFARIFEEHSHQQIPDQFAEN